ncbi:unnamed protein product [Closterium sp. Naga37s-1]|nr:unnamed protein product [Closterium sp. Naga37s-1]
MGGPQRLHFQQQPQQQQQGVKQQQREWEKDQQGGQWGGYRPEMGHVPDPGCVASNLHNPSNPPHHVDFREPHQTQQQQQQQQQQHHAHQHEVLEEQGVGGEGIMQAAVGNKRQREGEQQQTPCAVTGWQQQPVQERVGLSVQATRGTASPGAFMSRSFSEAALPLRLPHLPSPSPFMPQPPPTTSSLPPPPGNHHSQQSPLVTSTFNTVTTNPDPTPAPSAAPSSYPSATPMTAPSAAHLSPSELPPAAPPIIPISETPPAAPPIPPPTSRTSPTAPPISPSALLSALSSLQSKISALQVLVPLVAQSAPSEALQQQQEVAAVGRASLRGDCSGEREGQVNCSTLHDEGLRWDAVLAGADGTLEERRREGEGAHGSGGEVMVWGGDVVHGAVKEEVQAMDDVSMGGGDDIEGTPMPLHGTYYGAPDVTPDGAPDGAAYDGGAMACQAVVVPTASHGNRMVSSGNTRSSHDDAMVLYENAMASQGSGMPPSVSMGGASSSQGGSSGVGGSVLGGSGMCDSVLGGGSVLGGSGGMCMRRGRIRGGRGGSGGGGRKGGGGGGRGGGRGGTRGGRILPEASREEEESEGQVVRRSKLGNSVKAESQLGGGRGEDEEEEDEDEEEEGGRSSEGVTRGEFELVELQVDELLAEHTLFCEVCGKGFKRDANLRMHMRGHGDAYKGATSLSRPALSAARSADHPAARPQRYSCPEPGCKRNQQHPDFQPLKTILCVKNHYRRTHCAKQYTCSRCGVKQFAVLADLRTHEKHCGRSSWKCSCGSSFRWVQVESAARTSYQATSLTSPAITSSLPAQSTLRINSSRKDKLLGHLSHFTGHHAVAAGPSDLPLPTLPSPAASTPAASVDAAVAAASAAVSGAAAGDTAGSGGGGGSSSAAFGGYHERNSGVAMRLAGGGGRIHVDTSRRSSVIAGTNMAAGGSPAALSTLPIMARYAVVAFALLALFAVCHARPAPIDDDITDNTVVPDLKGLSREKIQELALTDLAAWDEEDNGVSAAEADKIVVDEDNTVSATDDAADDSDNTVAATSEDVADSENSVVASSADVADDDNTVAVAEPADSDNTVAVVAAEPEDDVVAVMPEDNVATASAAKSTDMGIAMVV